jgi:hypothetical protein
MMQMFSRQSCHTGWPSLRSFRLLGKRPAPPDQATGGGSGRVRPQRWMVYGLMMIRFSTFVTPGAAQAARSAS